jgi:hypothetical protein
MARIITSGILMMISFLAYSQRKKLEPLSLVIIKPREVGYDTKRQKYIDKRSAEINYEINNPIISIESRPGKKRPIVTRRHSISKIKVDYFSYAAFIAQDGLELNCVGLNKPCSIVIKELSKDDKNLSLQEIAEKERKNYVLDFTRIEIREKNKRFQANISIKFYNNLTRQYLIDSVFTGDEEEHENLDREGLSLRSDNAMDSAYFNAVSKILTRIDCSLNCGWIAEEASLEQRRKEVLIKNYFNKPFDKSILRKIIPSSDSSINIDISFQAIFNSDSTKFISFFLDKVTDSSTLAQVRLGVPDFADELVTYSYVVYGVRYNNKWYYSDRNYGTLVAPEQTLDGRRKDLLNKLQSYQYGFFKEQSIEPDPEFWETNLFGIVGAPGAYRFPDKSEELNNAPYKGLYVVVAQQFRQERRNAEKLVEEGLSKKYIDPLIHNLRINVADPGYFFIYPIDMSTILVPITENIGKSLYKVRYYVLIPDGKNNYEIYEWTYFNHSPPQSHSYGLVNDEVGKLTHWNAVVETIEDKSFWNNYVLLKDGTAYKYLKKPN